MGDIGNRYLRLAAAVGIAVGNTLSATAAEPQAEPKLSQAQVDRGLVAFNTNCASCHYTMLTGTLGPPLIGPTFFAKWGDKTAADLYRQIRAMPPSNPNTLRPQQSADVLAFLMSNYNNKISGSRELTPDERALSAFSAIEPATAKKFAGMSAPKFTTRTIEDISAIVAGGPTQAELTAADSKTTDWLTSVHDYSAQRYVELNQINATNVKNIHPVCIFHTGDTYPFQANPIVYRGMMFITTREAVIAIDAANCGVKWRYDRPSRMPKELLILNRGAAIKDAKVLYGTSDGMLVALDAGTGKQLWEHEASNALGGEGGFLSATMVYDNYVLLGPATSEMGVNGWLGAFRADNGEPVWKFHAVPKKGEFGADTWPSDESREHSGGAIWGTFTYDPKQGRLYVPVSNPIPDFVGKVRLGANLFSNSMVALDAKTGKYLWHYQVTPHDEHDWDLTQAGPLFTAEVKGRLRNLMAVVGKEGVLHVMDRDSHEVLSKTDVTTRLNATVPPSEADKSKIPVCPGALGAVLYNGPAYNAGTHMLYVNATDECAANDAKAPRGWLTAVNVTDGKVAWRFGSPQNMKAAVTTTSGNLVATGELNGNFRIFDARDGKVLYTFPVGGPMNGGVLTYAVNGTQYIAVTAGNTRFYNATLPSASTVVVFGLSSP
jgi:alcohol dehydrogenase (cytochrome c)